MGEYMKHNGCGSYNNGFAPCNGGCEFDWIFLLVIVLLLVFGFDIFATEDGAFLLIIIVIIVLFVFFIDCF